MKPVISVIIPAHNEEGYIGETLMALRQQTYRYYEVIVVANGCVDQTCAVARPLCDKLIDLPDRSLGKARNTGAAKARGDLLLFLDADTLLEPHALDEIAREFTSAHSSGTLRGWPDSKRWLYRAMYSAKNMLHRSGLHRGSSGVIICWRDQFKEAGGFINDLQVRENSELMRRLSRFGSYQYVGSTTATTSMRRYEKRGAKVLWEWLMIWFQSQISDLRHRSYEVIR